MTATDAPARPDVSRFSALFTPGEPVELNDDQLRACEVLCAIAAPYNLVVPGGSIPDAVQFHSTGLSVLLTSELATYDGDHLTRLVTAAHHHRVRVAIGPWIPENDWDRGHTIRRRCSEQVEGYCNLDGILDIDIAAIEVTLHARSADGHHLFDRHPGADDLAQLAAGNQPAT